MTTHKLKDPVQAVDIDPTKLYLIKKVGSVIRGIYNSQGYYSALTFIIKAGLAEEKDQAAAERILDWVIYE